MLRILESNSSWLPEEFWYSTVLDIPHLFNNLYLLTFFVVALCSIFHLFSLTSHGFKISLFIQLLLFCVSVEFIYLTRILPHFIHNFILNLKLMSLNLIIQIFSAFIWVVVLSCYGKGSHNRWEVQELKNFLWFFPRFGKIDLWCTFSWNDTSSHIS